MKKLIVIIFLLISTMSFSVEAFFSDIDITIVGCTGWGNFQYVTGIDKSCLYSGVQDGLYGDIVFSVLAVGNTTNVSAINFKYTPTSQASSYKIITPIVLSTTPKFSDIDGKIVQTVFVLSISSKDLMVGNIENEYYKGILEAKITLSGGVTYKTDTTLLKIKAPSETVIENIDYSGEAPIISWTPVVWTDGLVPNYIIWRQEKNETSPTKVFGISGSNITTSWTDNDVYVNPGTYTYQIVVSKVSSTNTQKTSSSPITITILPLGTPNVKLTSLGTGIKEIPQLLWNKVDKAKEYGIYRKKTDGTFESIGITDKFIFNDYNYISGTTPEYMVRAYNHNRTNFKDSSSVIFYPRY